MGGTRGARTSVPWPAAESIWEAIELLRCAADLALTGRGLFVAACAELDIDTASPVAAFAHRAWYVAAEVYEEARGAHRWWEAGDERGLADALSFLDAVALIQDGAL